MTRAGGRRGHGAERRARRTRPEGPAADESSPEVLFGLHPVLEAVLSGRRTVDRILVAREGGGVGAGRLLRAAREAGVPVRHLPREALARRVGPKAVHQGIAALVSPIAYAEAAALAEAAAADPAGLLVALDGVEDPRNLGAILRSACAAGARGVLLGGESTVGITPVAAKAAAGAAERIPVAREIRLARRLEQLGRRGFSIVGLESGRGVPWHAADLTGRTVLVAGAEGAGLGPSTTRMCTIHVAIPLGGGIESLNVSVAVAVVLFEAVRQRSRGLALS